MFYCPAFTKLILGVVFIISYSNFRTLKFHNVKV